MARGGGGYILERVYVGVCGGGGGGACLVMIRTWVRNVRSICPL